MGDKQISAWERRKQYDNQRLSKGYSRPASAAPRLVSDRTGSVTPRSVRASVQTVYGSSYPYATTSTGIYDHGMRSDVKRSTRTQSTHYSQPVFENDYGISGRDDFGSNHYKDGTGSGYYSARSHHSSVYEGREQVQRQTFRSAQASKQMVLEVYGNCITMLEELESREMRRRGERSLPRSDIYLPSQGHYDDSTIERKLDTQLILLQSQLQSCDSEIKGDVREEMEEGTLRWISGRNDRRVQHGQTDKYAGKLFEVIHKGKIKHPDVFYKPPSIGERDMQHAMGAFVAGSHKRNQLDDDFRRDPGRMAGTPMLRAGSGVSGGAERLLDVRPDLYTGIQRHWNGNLC